MGGNALSESLVFGVLAARSAVAHADALSSFSGFENLAKQAVAETLIPAGNKRSQARSLARRLGRLLWNQAGIVRSRDSLELSKVDIESILRELEVQQADNPRELCRLMECRNAALSGMAIVLSALKRTESRGSHFREDFPEENKAWQKHIYVHRKGGKIEISRIMPT